MKTLQIVLFILFIINSSFAQVSKGSKLRQEGKLEAAIEAYKNNYTENSKDKKNTYGLACVYALTFQIDSAFQYLSIALKDNNSLWVLADSDLFALTEDARWLKIEENQLALFQQENELKQPEYTKKLLRLIIKDQSLDYFIDQAKNYFIKQGYAPQWYYPLGAYKQEIIKNSQQELEELIAFYGWPKYSMVGKIAADAPLLVINHHPSDSVRKLYLPQIRNACLEKEGSCKEYAKIQDRILVNENKLQIYGMQFQYNTKRKLEPFPIKNPEYVDQRRAKIGLEPLKEYLKRKIDYDFRIVQNNL